MANIDLSSLSAAELQKLVAEAQQLQETKKKEEKASAKHQVEELARSLGFTIADLFASSTPTVRILNEDGTVKRTRTVKPNEFEYVHPENPEIVWSGRGRKPAWFEALNEADREATKRPA